MPICLVSLIDIDRQWFKSRTGLDAKQTHRNLAFCSYTILEETPSVMVVPDSLEDERFKVNELVLGPPFIRFYAGAAIIVNGVKLGSFCILDSVPHHDFDASKQSSLFSIADIVARRLNERHKYVQSVDSEIALLTTHVVYNLKYPSAHLRMIVTSMLMQINRMNKQMERLCDDASNPAHVAAVSALKQEITTAVQAVHAFNAGYDHFNHMNESSLSVAYLLKTKESCFADSTKNYDRLTSITLSDFMRTTHSILMRSQIASLTIDWALSKAVEVESPLEAPIYNGRCYRTHPDALLMLMFSSLYCISLRWSSVTIRMTFIRNPDGFVPPQPSPTKAKAPIRSFSSSNGESPVYGMVQSKFFFADALSASAQSHDSRKSQIALDVGTNERLLRSLARSLGGDFIRGKGEAGTSTAFYSVALPCMFMPL